MKTFDDEEMWTAVRRHNWRLATTAKWLAAIVLIGWAASYPARYIADCTNHFGAGDCAKAWAGWTD